MPRVTTVKAARKDYKAYGIKKGDTYYWWKFKRGPKVMSKTYPKRSQLTRSEFLGQLYDLQDRQGSLQPSNFVTAEDVQTWRDELVSDIESLRDEQEEKKSNMPESLQESSTGELLQERYDSCDQWVDELNNIDLEIDDDAEFDEWLEEKIGELQSAEYPG